MDLGKIFINYWPFTSVSSMQTLITNPLFFSCVCLCGRVLLCVCVFLVKFIYKRFTEAATQSATPTDEKPQNPNPASEVLQPTIHDGEDSKAEATKENSEVVLPTMQDGEDSKAEATTENSTTSVFLNAEPIRDEQVQNAVKFLSHPKVGASVVIYVRSFLERKGLTKEEIDEAFRRVPDPASTISTTQPAFTNQDEQLKSSSIIQPQAPASAISKEGTSAAQSHFQWLKALRILGFLVVIVAGIVFMYQNYIVPRLKGWIGKVVSLQEEDHAKKTNSKPNAVEEAAAAAAKAAAAAAADVARANKELLVLKTEGQSYILGQEDYRVYVTGSKPWYAKGRADFDMHSARPSSQPASAEPSTAPYAKSYMEEINVQARNTNQSVSNPRLTPEPKPWEVGQSLNGLRDDFQPQESNNGMNLDCQVNEIVNQFNGDSSVPWQEQENVRIIEIESKGETENRSFGVLTSEQPIQRLWVPPQPPPVAMPEAAAAIRQPKKHAFDREQLTDDPLLDHACPLKITDEFQRITTIAESGVVMEANGGSSVQGREKEKSDNSNFESRITEGGF